jgi:co-chaperonin GroES (HSP10)
MPDLPETRVRPILNQLVVLRDAAPVKIGSIILADTTRDRLQKEATSGLVLRVGPGKFRKVRKNHTRLMGVCPRCGRSGVAQNEECPVLVDTADRAPMHVRRGDRVWFHHMAGTANDRMADVEENGRRLTVMWSDEIEAYDQDVRGELELGDLLFGSGPITPDMIEETARSLSER